ncbi:hypothetical protein HNR60_001535 [Rhodopseudomonas rhenobacensis]|uniref:Uncharacterized protein n=1 Tax=Rhodopseudomonas rhenobacensis TaxID=87461 RepID=A0A7W8DYF6_9BRAD|nr:hypothetical protein [Rhodopseudomonas rhenobacensis]MBB5046787.1 hypothetical protein [Rhodopseudomonas rhenobacensis]
MARAPTNTNTSGTDGAQRAGATSNASTDQGAGTAATTSTDAATPPKKRAAKAETQEHVVTREVLHDGDLYVAGDDISLTRDQHAQMHAVGAVEEVWRA